MAKASPHRVQACLCQSPSLLHRHKLHLFQRLQQMDPSVNPSITRKAKEDVQTVPGWETFIMPEVRRLDSYTSGWLPLEAIKRTEVILGVWTAQVEHISLPSLGLWLVPEHRGCPFLNRRRCQSDLSCCGSADSDCHFHSYHNSVWGYVSISKLCPLSAFWNHM